MRPFYDFGAIRLRSPTQSEPSESEEILLEKIQYGCDNPVSPSFRSWTEVHRVRSIIVSLCLVALLSLVDIAFRLQHSQKFTPEQMCPVVAYDNGQWIQKAEPATRISNEAELLAAAGFKGCAGNNEEGWAFFGIGSRDYRRLNVDSYNLNWQGHERCHLYEPTMLQKLQALVDGPIALVGDSFQRQLFFQYSCELSGHVIYELGPDHPGPALHTWVDREWKYTDQRLRLNPHSPLYGQLRLPRGFDHRRALVSYVAMWMPQSIDEILTSVGDRFPWLTRPHPDRLMELVKPMNSTIATFTDPKAAMRTMVLNMGAHYSHIDSFLAAPTDSDMLEFARWTMKTYLVALSQSIRADQRVLVRASPPGMNQTFQALPEVGMPSPYFNWQLMPDLADILRDETVLLGDSRIVWIGGERQSRTRPDGHLDDILHLATGTGVLDAVTQYIWHFVTQTW